MAATPAPSPAPSRAQLVFVGIAAVAVMVALAIGVMLGTGSVDFRAAEKITATPSRLATRYPTIPSDIQTQGHLSGPKDDRFVSLMASLADRSGFPRAGRDAMITAAHQVCAMVAAGRSVTDASTALRVGYGFTDAQAQGVGAMGLQVYCPWNRP